MDRICKLHYTRWYFERKLTDYPESGFNFLARLARKLRKESCERKKISKQLLQTERDLNLARDDVSRAQIIINEKDEMIKRFIFSIKNLLSLLISDSNYSKQERKNTMNNSKKKSQ